MLYCLVFFHFVVFAPAAHRCHCVVFASAAYTFGSRPYPDSLSLLNAWCDRAGASLVGKSFLVTGATDGIGRHTAGRLAQEGATVLLHGRCYILGYLPINRFCADLSWLSLSLSAPVWCV
jgi:hypothetical protein